MEGRISILYQIQDSERLMDTNIFAPAHTDISCASTSCHAAYSLPPPVITPEALLFTDNAAASTLPADTPAAVHEDPWL
ncbi:Hypothetical protein SMAX5B_021322 [Scophthalmus maximus]|uniref:Uncharacterized protein n=1 Tax=Scophthalmus maximus TaxID=52904 RepID=A0A2U9B3T4_SCOMX|nr:Hypothetical protein SMAX5B_021322 [Scophthalmus maximus]